MTSVLTQRSGQPSRIMWPTVTKGLPKIERELERVVNRVMQAVSRNI
jgi:hypothetical protein